MYTINLSKKVALITGAYQGIGLEIAHILAESGCRLVIVDINKNIHEIAKKISNSYEIEVYSIQANLTSVIEIESVVKEAYQQFENIDILINNAGVMQTKPFLDITENDWDFIFNLNLKGMFFLSQLMVKEMLARNTEGNIVNMSSIAGRSGRPLSPHYAASKASIISLTKSMAEAFGKSNIRTNAVCPGVIATPMMQQIYASRKLIENINVEEKFLEIIKLDRLGTPCDVANTVLYLCSDLSSYVNGQSINVCGGYEMD